MIKDNHIALCKAPRWHHRGCRDYRTREKFPTLKIEVEVDTLEQLETELPAEPDWVLLDNMTLEALKKAVKICDGRCQTEASDGVLP